MITKDDLKNKLLEFVKEATTNSDLSAATHVYLKFVTEHYEELDPEAKKMGDHAFTVINKMIEEALAKMPDSVEKRKIDRLQNKSWNIKGILDALQKKTHLKEPILIETEELFFEIVQIVTDFLH